MQIYKVGGAVRDRLLGRPVSETDWVVVGATAEQMQAQGFRPVGADFPVFLHPETGEEYALARTERKSGRGYGGFTFYASPEVTLEEDLQRRDLTINAIAEDEHGRLIDPYHGQRDLAQKWLRHVAPAFAEDPLRALRVARFAARYAELGFRIAPPTLELMRQLSRSGELQALTPERSWKEISRALMEPRPDVFVQVLLDCGALAELFAELQARLAGGDCTTHLLEALRECARREQPLAVRWACLLAPLADPAGDSTALAEAVNQRSKAPRDCQELALLTARFGPIAQHTGQLSAAALFDLLQHFDIYRRPERFEHFLDACQILADAALWGPGRCPTELLRSAARAAREVSAAPLIARGHRAAELGEALKRERFAAVAKVLADARL
ncbi:multifunctional CCA addition/repair protein [Pseudomonas oligotrophica]|uniref:multifunctional CCA addition/repair protein n=1 Tax=Pseudomonas oligotrophica TaxID=2912055 RepID=UPI001F028042|nr:multifunctional CCA addition/repair protein [Pseudomonas oligotrophica]MCF7201510.1 multifunctional CCA addition/repair protein [Pseudomonas oligotrophica]